MSELRSENYHVEQKEIAEVVVRVTSYKIGDRYYCHVTNLDPGATIARSEGANQKEAETLALAIAEKRLRRQLNGMSSL